MQKNSTSTKAQKVLCNTCAFWGIALALLLGWFDGEGSVVTPSHSMTALFQFTSLM